MPAKKSKKRENTSALPTKQQLKQQILAATTVIEAETSSYAQKADACRQRAEARTGLARLERRELIREDRMQDTMLERYYGVYAAYEEQNNKIKRHEPLVEPRIVIWDFLAKADACFQAGEQERRAGETTRCIEQYEKAKAQYSKALDYNPEHIQARRNLVNMGLLLQKEAEIATHCEWLLQISKDDYIAKYMTTEGDYTQHLYDLYCQYGCVKMAMRLFEEAILNFELAKTLNPNLPMAYIGLGKVAEALGQHEKKLTWGLSVSFQQEGRNVLFSPKGYQDLSLEERSELYDNHVMGMQEKYEQAKAYYHQALEIAPSSGEARQLLEALQYAETLAHISMMKDYDMFAGVFQQRRNFKFAMDMYNRAVIFAENYPASSTLSVKERRDKIAILKRLDEAQQGQQVEELETETHDSPVPK